MATTTTLDKIVRTALSKKNYPLHFYTQFLVYGREALQELTMDDLKVFNTKILPVNSYNAVDIPADYLDYVVVGVMTEQGIRPLVETNKMNVLNNFDSNYNIQEWMGDVDTNTGSSLIYYGGFPFSQWYTTHWNNFGENIGRYYGSRGGYSDTFTISKDRNQIQLNEHLQGLENIYLQYASDGSDSGSATTIDPYAELTIQSYMMWQHKNHNRTYSETERAIAKQEYIQQRQILRARKSDLTLTVLKRIINRESIGSPK